MRKWRSCVGACCGKARQGLTSVFWTTELSAKNASLQRIYSALAFIFTL